MSRNYADINLLNYLIDACNYRYYAIYAQIPPSSDFSPVFPHVTVGSVACALSLANHPIGLNAIYRFIFGTLKQQNWVHPTQDFNGFNNIPILGESDYETLALGGNKPRHVFPKEFTSTTTQWLDGNPIAEGDLARNITANGDGRIYQRIGGEWLITDEVLPETVTLYSWNDVLIPGEIIGEWLFEDMVNMLNIMTRYKVAIGSLAYDPGSEATVTLTSWETNPAFSYTGVSAYNDYPAGSDSRTLAEASADSHWAYDGATGTYLPSLFVQWWTGDVLTNNNHLVVKQRRSPTVTSRNGKWLNRTVEFYFIAEEYVKNGDTIETVAPEDPVVQFGKYSKWDTQTVAASTNAVSNPMGATTLPDLDNYFGIDTGSPYTPRNTSYVWNHHQSKSSYAVISFSPPTVSI